MKRSEQKVQDTWALMYSSSEEWQKDYDALLVEIEEINSYKGKLNSREDLLSFLKLYEELGIKLETVSIYASLSLESDGQNPENQRLMGLTATIGSMFGQYVSFFTPELLAIDRALLLQWIEEPEFKDFKIFLEKNIYEAKHTLSAREEYLLSLNSKAAAGAANAYHDLCDIDLDFGYVGDEKLTISNYVVFLRSKDEKVRKEAYEKLYGVYKNHENTISKLYAANVDKNLFYAKAKGFDSCLERALFPDNVDKIVYKNLVDTVNENLPILHRYYTLVKKVLKLDTLNHYDVYMPLVDSVESNYTYDEACLAIKEATKVLGSEYQDILYKGLTTDRWVDRYENEGKRSGAFSAGTYKNKPYILMNYKDNVISSLFTLIHEGGHSMHSYYSSKSNPFSCYDYTIFEAEVASTFNEQLLSHYLLESTKDVEMKKYLLGSQLFSIVSTLFRQTMFAEFELLMHEIVEKGGVITCQVQKDTYQGLLEKYFGPELKFDKELSCLECFRIPHFYRAFYVYKYATGISSSITLAENVLAGNGLENYLAFLKSGGTKFPLDSLKLAGVDLSTKEPIEKAIKYFEKLLNEFSELV